jgi:hypothetical protein
MVKKRCAKGAQQTTLRIVSENTSELHCYPDKFSITNLLRRGFSTQLKGGYR